MTAAVVVPTESPPQAADTWWRMTLERCRPLLMPVMLLSLGVHIFMLAVPVFCMIVYDRVIGVQALDTLPMLVAGMACAFLTEFMLRAVRSRLVAWLGVRLDRDVGQSLFRRLLFVPASLGARAPVAAQMARAGAFESVRDFLTGPMFLTLLEVPYMGILVLVLGLLAGPVALVGLGVLAIYGLLLVMLAGTWQRMGREMTQAAAERQLLLMESIDNMKMIYAAGMADTVVQRYRSISRRATQLQCRHNLLATAVQYISALLSVVAGVVIINWSLHCVWSGTMTGGAMVATMIITWRLLYPLQAICALVPHFGQVRQALQQVLQVMALTPERHAHTTAPGFARLHGGIELQNVSLRYAPGADPIFWGLNARINKGDIVAIYGSNGSGKSSLVRLLLGLNTPGMGTVRFDGIDHRQLDPRVLRRQIAYLSQEPEFLPGTLAENLRMVNAAASEADIRDALQRADAWDAVEALPQGIHAQLGAEGTALSDTLAARLNLARLYLAARPIVLCDELPGHVLNSNAGAHFRHFLHECRGKRTVIFVTHHNNWLQLADKVIWMKQGVVPSIGKPALVAKTGEEHASCHTS
ncbi:MAG: peptidase domain-containing ABC transporter [Bdellovibrionales bacterium]